MVVTAVRLNGSPVQWTYPARQPFRAISCEEPFRNIIEILSPPHAKIFSDWPPARIDATDCYRGLSSNGAENRVNASSLLDRLSILLNKKHIGTRVRQLPHVLQGHRLVEPARKSSPRRY